MHRFKELEKFSLYHELKVKIFQDFKFSLSTFKLKNNIKNFKNSVGLGRIYKNLQRLQFRNTKKDKNF